MTETPRTSGTPPDQAAVPESQLHRPRTLHVTVRDAATGAAIPGAGVHVRLSPFLEGDEGDSEFFRSATTDESGVAEFRKVPGDLQIEVQAKAEGYLPVQQRMARSSTAFVSLTLPLTAALSDRDASTVVDVVGVDAAVRGEAVVFIRDAEQGHVTVLRPGESWRIDADPGGRGTKRVLVAAAVRGLMTPWEERRVRRGEPTTIPVSLVPALLHVHARRDDGSPVEGATVAVRPKGAESAGSLATFTGLTDDRGDVQFEAARDARVIVTCIHPGVAFTPESQVVAIDGRVVDVAFRGVGTRPVRLDVQATGDERPTELFVRWKSVPREGARSDRNAAIADTDRMSVPSRIPLTWEEGRAGAPLHLIPGTYEMEAWAAGGFEAGAITFDAGVERVVPVLLRSAHVARYRIVPGGGDPPRDLFMAAVIGHAAPFAERHGVLSALGDLWKIKARGLRGRTRDADGQDVRRAMASLYASARLRMEGLPGDVGFVGRDQCVEFRAPSSPDVLTVLLPTSEAALIRVPPRGGPLHVRARDFRSVLVRATGANGVPLAGYPVFASPSEVFAREGRGVGHAWRTSERGDVSLGLFAGEAALLFHPNDVWSLEVDGGVAEPRGGAQPTGYLVRVQRDDAMVRLVVRYGRPLDAAVEGPMSLAVAPRSWLA